MKAYPRKVLGQEGLLIPVGEKSMLPTNTGYKYRWVSEDNLQIFYEGNWADAYSIDFGFK